MPVSRGNGAGYGSFISLPREVPVGAWHGSPPREEHVGFRAEVTMPFEHERQCDSLAFPLLSY